MTCAKGRRGATKTAAKSHWKRLNVAKTMGKYAKRIEKMGES
jgi:hypothetical protein